MIINLLLTRDYRGRREPNSPALLPNSLGGVLDEVSLREMRMVWTRLKLYYRVLAGVATRDLSTKVLGQSVSMPIGRATAFHRLACEAGEIATARAAKAAGPLFVLSSLSNTAMESVLCTNKSALVPALYVQGSDDHARAGATGRGCRSRGNRPDGGRQAWERASAIREIAFACRTAWWSKTWGR